jgi:hypothetical protein
MRYVPLALLLAVAGSARSRPVETVPAPSPQIIGGPRPLETPKQNGGEP